MKAGNFRMWRPFLGVTVVSALAIAVSVQGGPRDGSLRTERGAKAGTSRLLSGPSDTVRSSVAAAGVTAVVQLTPKADHFSGAYGNGGYYTNADISGQRLTVAGGGGITFWEAELHSWGAAGLVRSYEVRVDAMGLLGANADCGTGAGSCVGAADLLNGSVPCANAGTCITAYGNVLGAGCNGGVCAFAFITTGRDDWLFKAPDIFGTFQADCGINDPAGANCFAALTESSESRADLGLTEYLATYVFEVPAGAKGVYTLPWVGMNVSTFLGDDQTPPQNVDLAAAVPGELEVTVGACCTDLGAGSCVDGITSSQCDDVQTTNARVFSAGQTCPGAGGANDLLECPSCTSDADCNDNDACTVDSCNLALFACTNIPIAAWDQGAGQCCDAVTGDVCSPEDANTCSVASCSIAGQRGTCIQTAVAAGDACNGVGDDNPCTFDDICAADESCSGTDVTASAIACTTDQECADATGLTAPSCVSGFCECSLVPDLTIAFDDSGKADGLCFTAGSKITASVNVAAATAPVNGGQFLINYDPSCMRYNSVAGAGAYSDLVFGPVVDEAAGTIFVVVGVGFGAGDGPAGNASMLSLSFTKMGMNACDSCDICFDSNNPMNTYLVDNSGQRIGVNPICSDNVVANNDVSIDVPDSIKSNVDCGQPTAMLDWAAPSVSDSCGNSTLTCLEQHESETTASPARMTGGEFVAGRTNICCSAASDWCGKVAGSPGSPASAASDTGGDGCWTVEVNDQTAIDITIGLSPSASTQPGDGLTRCIKFTLYANTIQAPEYFSVPVEFGGGLDIVGKSKDALKIPGHGNWDCITAWDQLHTLRSCYLFGAGDCSGGSLSATFRGDPAFGGNWLIGGNLDGWKKNLAGSEPSIYTIDVLDYGTFVSQFGADYGTGDTDCDTVGPHADIDGDGLVTTDDYAFISMNFLTSSKSCCGVEGLPAGASGVSSISIEQLRRSGRGDLAVADLNGDGILNVDDMNAFMQGARPSTKGSTPRKGR